MTADSDLAAEPRYAPAAAYDLAAAHYDGWKWQAFWRRVEWPAISDAVDAWAASHGRPRLLDIGCGTGWYMQELGPRCERVAGVDISPAMLARARARAPGAECLEADIRRLPFGDQAFDIVLCTRVLSHVAEVDQAVGEMARVAREGGVLIVSNIDARHDYRDTRLPVGRGHIHVETFKHDRATVDALLRREGLRHVRSELIALDRPNALLAALGEDTTRPAVGWISVWSRDGGRI